MDLHALGCTWTTCQIGYMGHVMDLSFRCTAVPRCQKKRQCASFDNCPSRNDPTPSDEELFAAYWKDQERTNFYAHGPAQIAQGLRNVYLLAIEELRRNAHANKMHFSKGETK